MATFARPFFGYPQFIDWDTCPTHWGGSTWNALKNKYVHVHTELKNTIETIMWRKMLILSCKWVYGNGISGRLARRLNISYFGMTELWTVEKANWPAEWPNRWNGSHKYNSSKWTYSSVSVEHIMRLHVNHPWVSSTQNDYRLKRTTENEMPTTNSNWDICCIRFQQSILPSATSFPCQFM